MKGCEGFVTATPVQGKVEWVALNGAGTGLFGASAFM